jgi:hypothetical protein
MSQPGLTCKPHDHENHEILDIKSCKLQFGWTPFGGMSWNLGKSKYWRANGCPYQHERGLENFLQRVSTHYGVALRKKWGHSFN